MASLQGVFKNTLSQILGRGVTVGVSILLTAYLARPQGLGKEGYGEYSFITALVLLFGTIADWGTNIITVREASQHPEKQPTIFGTTIIFRLLLSLVAFLLLQTLVLLNPEWQKFQTPLLIGSFVLIALSLKTSFSLIFQTKLKFQNTAVVEGVSSLSFLLLILLFFIVEKNLGVVIFSWLLSTIMSALVAFYLVGKLTPISWKLDKEMVKKIFWEALPAGALFIVFTIYNRIDVLLLQLFKGSIEVSSYSLAYKVHDNLVLGAAFLMNSVFPYLASSYLEKNSNKVKEYYQKIFDLLFGFGIFLLLVVYFLSPLIINLLGGREYQESVLILRVLIFATFLAYLNHLTGFSLIAFGRQRTSLFIAIVALLFNVVLNIALIPKYSYMAPAYVTVATEALVLLLSSIAIKRTIGVFPTLSSFIKTFLLFAKTRKL